MENFRVIQSKLCGIKSKLGNKSERERVKKDLHFIHDTQKIILFYLKASKRQRAIFFLFIVGIKRQRQ